MLQKEGGAADARGWAEGLHARKKKGNHPSGRENRSGARPPEEELPGHRDGQGLGSGYYLVATEEGFLYLAFILDVHSSRRVVGWAMEGHLTEGRPRRGWMP